MTGLLFESPARLPADTVIIYLPASSTCQCQPAVSDAVHAALEPACFEPVGGPVTLPKGADGMGMRMDASASAACARGLDVRRDFGPVPPGKSGTGTAEVRPASVCALLKGPY